MLRFYLEFNEDFTSGSRTLNKQIHMKIAKINTAVCGEKCSKTVLHTVRTCSLPIKRANRWQTTPTRTNTFRIL